VDAGDGLTVDFEHATAEPLPTHRWTKSPRERHLSYALDEETYPDDGADASPAHPTGKPGTKLREDGLLLIYDEPPPPDDEPVFWTE
jgi:hypothetical protein